MSDTSRNGGRPMPEWLVERACLDELPAGLAAEHRELLAGAQLGARRAEIERSNAEILESLPPAGVAAEVARRERIAARQRGRQRAARLAGLSAVAVACAVVIAVIVVPRDPDPAPPDRPDQSGDIIRVKGDPRLLVHRKRGDQIDQLGGASASARSGDLIQLSYLAGSARYGAVLSIDGAGVVTLHFPDSTTGSTRLVAASQPISLAHSYELDDAPAFERFIFVTSDRPIDVAALVRSAEALGGQPGRARLESLPVAPELRQLSLVVRKEAP